MGASSTERCGSCFRCNREKNAQKAKSAVIVVARPFVFFIYLAANTPRNNAELILINNNPGTKNDKIFAC